MSQKSDTIFTEQVRMLYANSLVAILFSAAVGLLFWWTQWTVMDQGVLIVWFSIFIGISTARLLLLIAYKRINPPATLIHRWNSFFLAGLYCISLLYATAPFFYIQQTIPPDKPSFFWLSQDSPLGA